MAAKYWPVAVQKEESASLYPVRQIDRNSVTEYLHNGRRTTMRGITLYTKPTDSLEVGFLIRKKAGTAVRRVKTRRLFRGLLQNSRPEFNDKHGYLFLFHHAYFSTPPVKNLIQQLLKRADHDS